MDTPIDVLFLCTGNSCRSIIGEALADHLGEGRLRGLSAGSRPTGQVNPGALAVLERHGVPVDQPSSKSMDALEGEAVDLVVTVCDAAAGEECPLWLAPAPRVHWGIPDPATVTGDEAVVRAAFERTYAQLEARILRLLELDLEDLAPGELVTAARELHRSLEAAS